MIKQFAKAITSFLIKDKIIKADEMDIYQFGLEQIFINLITFFLIGIIATVLSTWIETIFWFAGMIPIRMVAGGYHASTPVKCNILTFSVYIVNMIVIQLIKTYMTYLLLFVLCVVTILLIILFAPVDHKNRTLRKEERLVARKKSRVIGIILIGFCIGISILYGSDAIVSISTMMGVFTASISLFIGNIVRGGERNEETKFFA